MSVSECQKYCFWFATVEGTFGVQGLKVHVCVCVCGLPLGFLQASLKVPIVCKSCVHAQRLKIFEASNS